MGSFSWTRAEHTTDRSNITDHDRYKLLVPIKFGRGYVIDTYCDYGHVVTKTSKGTQYVDNEGNVYNISKFPTNDIFGILAYWNNVRDLEFEGDIRPTNMLDILKYGKTCDNRHKGIRFNFYEYQDFECSILPCTKYPLKLVSNSYIGTYENCKGISFDDPKQGFIIGHWDKKYEYCYDTLTKFEKGELTYGYCSKESW